MLNAYHRMCFAGFVVDFTVIVGMTAIPFFVLDQIEGGNVALSGIIMASQMAAYALVCIAASGFVQRARHGLNWAIFGVVLYTAIYAMIPLFRSPLVCGALASVATGGMALVWPALHSWVGAEPDPKSRTRHMAWFNLSWSLGFAAGPLLAGPLYDYDYWVPFAVMTALGGTGIALLLSLPHEHAYFGTASPEQLHARAGHDRSSEIYLYCAWCATFVANGLHAVTRSVYPDRIKTLVETAQLRLLFEGEPARFLTEAPATKFSWPASALSVATMITFLVLWKTDRWRHRFEVLIGMQVLTAIAFFILGHTCSLIVMTLCFIIVGANHGVAFFSSAYYSLANPALKHRRASINEGAVGLGGFAGSMVFAYLVATYAFSLPFHYTPVFVAVAIGLQLCLLRYGRLRVERREACAAASPL